MSKRQWNEATKHDTREEKRGGGGEGGREGERGESATRYSLQNHASNDFSYFVYFLVENRLFPHTMHPD